MEDPGPDLEVCTGLNKRKLRAFGSVGRRERPGGHAQHGFRAVRNEDPGPVPHIQNGRKVEEAL
jgi:hypothetical protein